MLLSSAKKTQIQCFWQLWIPRQLWLAGWQGVRNGFSPPQAWMEVPCAPSLQPLFPRPALVSSKVHPRLLWLFPSDKFRSPLALLGCVLAQSSKLLLAWLGDLVKNMHKQFSLDVLPASLIPGHCVTSFRHPRTEVCGCVQPARWYWDAPVRVSTACLAAVPFRNLGKRPSLHQERGELGWWSVAAKVLLQLSGELPRREGKAQPEVWGRRWDNTLGAAVLLLPDVWIVPRDCHSRPVFFPLGGNIIWYLHRSRPGKPGHRRNFHGKPLRSTRCSLPGSCPVGSSAAAGSGGTMAAQEQQYKQEWISSQNRSSLDGLCFVCYPEVLLKCRCSGSCFPWRIHQSWSHSVKWSSRSLLYQWLIYAV